MQVITKDEQNDQNGVSELKLKGSDNSGGSNWVGQVI
jgi:hypothetical protein